MIRPLAFAGLFALTLLPSPAFADSIAITAGNCFLYWDSSLTSVIVASSDSQFVTESHSGSDGGFAGGATVDLSTTIPFTNQGFHPLAQTYHGQQFQAWVSGSMQIVAKPFVAPHAPPSADGTFQAFTTTFTMSGTITAWATSDRTGTPLFTTSLTGRGIITAGPYRVTGDSYVQRNGDFLAFDSPSSPPCNAWASHDVGAVGIQGGAGACGFGKIDVFGSGADIWGTADAFQFLSLPIAADGQIVAQLTSAVQNTASGATDPFAKAGLMIRQSLDPGSPDVILDVRPDGEIEFMTRSAAGGPTSFLAGGSTSFPVWLRLSRRGQLVEGDVSADGTAWTTVGSTPAAGGDALVGLAVTSHDTSARDLGSFTQVGLWRLPPGWSQQDVGAVGPAGTATATDGVFTVAGAGSDIWGSMDAFNAVTGTIGQQATLVARVVDEQDTQMFAKAGVTFGSPTPSAARVILDVRPDGNIEFMSRLAGDGVMSYIGGASVAFPVWLRLIRAGDQVTGSISSDGSTWTEVGRVNVALPASVAGGLAVTSHDASQLNTATFDNVTLVTDGSSPPNLLQDPGFESSVPPSFASPGWTSDTVRQTPAQSETSEPHSGAMNGACRTTSALDCGIYQDVVAPADGHYTFTVYANASRPGAWIGVNVNNAGVQSTPLEVRGAGSYGTPYSLMFTASAGDTIRVWLYSPNVAGSAVIDDASLTY
jgi:hypothetical protein